MEITRPRQEPHILDPHGTEPIQTLLAQRLHNQNHGIPVHQSSVRLDPGQTKSVG